MLVWLEFKLAYFLATVQHFSHYAKETPPKNNKFNNQFFFYIIYTIIFIEVQPSRLEL